MKYARRRDSNEKPIIEALKAAGAFVQPLDGTGVPDLLVGYKGQTFLIEVKDPKMGARNSRTQHGHKTATGMRESQEKWWAQWLGAQPHLVTTPEEAVAFIQEKARAA